MIFITTSYKFNNIPLSTLCLLKFYNIITLKVKTKFIKGVCFYTCVGLHTICRGSGIQGKACLGVNTVSEFVT